jgi:hypothetical protein
VPAKKREEYLTSKDKDTVPVLDLLALGYSKVFARQRPDSGSPNGGAREVVQQGGRAEDHRGRWRS